MSFVCQLTTRSTVVPACIALPRLLGCSSLFSYTAANPLEPRSDARTPERNSVLLRPDAIHLT